MYGRLRRLPSTGLASSPRRGVRTRAFPRARTTQAASAASRARSLARYQEVRRRRAAGESSARHQKGHGPGASHRAPLRPRRELPRTRGARPRTQQLDPFIPWLEERLAAGRANASALYRELRERGYPRQQPAGAQVGAYAAGHPGQDHAACRRDLPPVPGQAAAPPLASPRQLAWLLLQPAAKLDAWQTATITQVEQDKEVRKAGALARRFTALVQASGTAHRRAPRTRLAALTRWLNRARTCKVQALQTFAAGLQQDLASIEAALTTGWSNGQTEGHVNQAQVAQTSDVRTRQVRSITPSAPARLLNPHKVRENRF